MNNFLDLLDTEQPQLAVQLMLTAVVDNGIPVVQVLINDIVCYSGSLLDTVTVSNSIPLLSPIVVKIILDNKQYSSTLETGVVINSLLIDNIDMVPVHVDCISYHNDQHENTQAFYLGFNGTWQFEINEPFYQWLHRNTAQGWLLYPNQ